jgi:hypothetical protein
MGLSRWVLTVLRRMRRARANRRSGWLYEQVEPRLYITQLEERRVLTASPMDQDVMDFATGGAISQYRPGWSSLTFEQAADPATGPTSSAVHGAVPAARDDSLVGVTGRDDGPASLVFAEAGQGFYAGLSEGNLVVEFVGDISSSEVTLQLVHEDRNEYLQISDPGNTLVAGCDVIQVDKHTLRVLTEKLTGTMTLIGGSGADTLTVDLSEGNPIPTGGLVFQAGDGHDNLNVRANGQDVAFVLGRTAGEGTITVGGRTIHFTGIGSDTVTLTQAATVTLNLTGATRSTSRRSARHDPGPRV